MKKITIEKQIIFSEVLTSQNLILSIRTAYMLSFLITVQELSLLKTIFSFSIFLLEIPTGLLADRFGNRRSSIVGIAFFSIHALFYVLFPDFTGLILTNIFLAVSAACLSGSKNSYYKALCEKYDLKIEDLKKKIQFSQNFFNVIFTLVSGLLFALNPSINFYVTFAFGAIATVLFIGLPKIDCNNNVDRMSLVLKNTISIIFTSRIRLTELLFFSVGSSFLIFNFEYYQFFFQEYKVPVELYGMVYAFFPLLSNIGVYVYKFKKLDYLPIFILPFSLLFMIFNHPTIFFISIIFQQIIFSYILFRFEIFIIESANNLDYMSTYQSSMSFIQNIIKCSLFLILSFLLNYISLNYIYVILSIITLFISLSCYLLLKKERILVEQVNIGK
ncbi:MFS transporter [Paenibacillus sp. A3M_27_13]|uniref:MFS transporter n=1 Tax=Paenibacillus sp. A3M_27_13 TaxID=2962029 RepID=UPI0020B8A775|nr:MFS transporter [Paenibacillus sp. A3M_27_13]MCP3746811.1 MFS transporter [Paenibacillus sp. A3M_27_13]